MDKEVLKILYEKYSREIYLYLFSFCRSRELAEDLMQETFLKAILSLPDDHTNMRAWMYMVARNLYFNHEKREKRYNRLSEASDRGNGGTEEVLEKMILNEERRILYQAIGRLKNPFKEVLLMQYFGGLSQKEIAAILHMSPENVRVTAYRAKKKIREELEVSGYDIS